jgi:hypothetical protein
LWPEQIPEHLRLPTGPAGADLRRATEFSLGFLVINIRGKRDMEEPGFHLDGFGVA